MFMDVLEKIVIQLVSFFNSFKRIVLVSTMKVNKL